MLSAADRREVKRAKALLQAGDRAGALLALRRLEVVPGRSAFDVPAQLVLRFMTFRCERLDGEETPAHICVARQERSEAERTRDTWRGQSPEYPSCQTHLCAQGRAVRDAMAAPQGKKRWRGFGQIR